MRANVDIFEPEIPTFSTESAESGQLFQKLAFVHDIVGLPDYMREIPVLRLLPLSEARDSRLCIARYFVAPNSLNE